MTLDTNTRCVKRRFTIGTGGDVGMRRLEFFERLDNCGGPCLREFVELVEAVIGEVGDY